MIRIRPAGERGKTQTGWLDSRHTFSFGDYHDPQNMGFSHLRVINEDRVRPGAGFPTHSHRDMEIITYVLEGARAAGNHLLWSGSGGAYKAQACCPRLEGLVPGSETEVSTYL